MSTWHAACGQIPIEILTMINERVAGVPLPPVKVRALTYQAQCVRLRQEVDSLREEVETHKLVAAVTSLEPQRQQRQFEYANNQLKLKLQASEDSKVHMRKDYLSDLKQARATHAFEATQLLGEMCAASRTRGVRPSTLPRRRHLR